MPRRPALLLIALLLSGCSLGAPGAGPSARSGATPIPGVSPEPSSKPSAPATATPGPLAACRLPVASGDAPVDGNTSHGAAGHGGFIQFPAGTFASDPTSMGDYDRAVAHWLPVLRAWVSPDGKRYAYTVNQPASGPVAGNVHIVDAATGSEHTVGVPAPSNVVSWEAEGIYIARVVPSSGAAPQGLTLVNPDSGSFKQVTADGTWSSIAGGAAFGADLDATVAPPASEGPGAANRIRRLDLGSGSVTTVLSSPGNNLQLLGVAGSAPVYSVASRNGAYTVVGPGGPIFQGTISNENPTGPVVADAGVVWLSSNAGTIWRFDGTGSARKVAATPLTSALVAGACR